MAPVGGSEEDFLNEIITDIENNGNANPSITVFPNPTTGKVFVSLNGMEGEIHLELFDVCGKRVLYQRTTAFSTELELFFFWKGECIN